MTNRRTWIIAAVLAVALTAVAYLTMTPAHSPLEDEAQVLALQKEWNQDILLPTKLPGTPYLKKASHTEAIDGRPPAVSLTMDLMMKDGSVIPQIEILEEYKPEEKKIDTIYGLQVDVIQHQMKIPELKYNQSFPFGQFEAFQANGVSGYWYTVRESHGVILMQTVELLQDDYHVHVTVNLPEEKFAKEKLIEIATNLRAF